LYFKVKRLFVPLVIPFILIILSMVIGWQWDKMLVNISSDTEIRAFIIIFPLIPYLLFAIIAILGIRSNNTDLIIISFILSYGYYIYNNLSGDLSMHSASIIPALLSFLLPINIFIFSIIGKKRYRTILLYFVIIFCEVLLVQFLIKLVEFPGSKIIVQFNTEFPEFASSLYSLMQYLRSIFLKTSIIDNVTIISMISFVTIIIIMTFRFVYTRNEKIGGYIFIIVALFLASCSDKLYPEIMVFFTACGLILLITTIETSFSMAYIDELTGLHGRRSLEETLEALNKNYAIAMIDIDFFKKFNDKYGHKTGDQVLKMVASILSEVSGGAKVYRYGGEEFTAIFPGKSASNAKPYMEEYRNKLETSEFVVRSPKRKTSSSQNRGKAASKDNSKVVVTVSIGIAGYGANQTKPEKVLKAADKILYKAKRLGRNRVEIQKNN